MLDLGRTFLQCVERSPNALALVDGELELTYAAWHRVILNGADGILHHCEKRLGIHAGETTPDGSVTLRTAECLAACGGAPMMQVDRDYHERLSLLDVDRILDRIVRE